MDKHEGNRVLNELSELIKKNRKKLGLGLREYGELLGISHASVARLEKALIIEQGIK